MARSRIRAVEMVRRIRDEQAKLLGDKSEGEVLEFFRKAGEAAREEARTRRARRPAIALRRA